MDLDVSFEQEAGRCIITVDGEIDVYTSPVLRQQLLSANECDTVIVSLDKVGFIDSSGLGVLVGALRRAREHGGDLRIVCDREQTLKVFRITGLDKVLPIHATMEEALES